MNTPASIRRHPIHPMLVALPIGLWIASLACDILYHAGSHNPFWKGVAFYAIAGGVAAALLAAIPGFIDYLSLTNRRTRKIATMHMVLNLIVVAMFLFNLGIRYNASPGAEMFAVMLSVVAIVFLSVSGWLGGVLVYEHHVGVSPPRDEREIDRRAA